MIKKYLLLCLPVLAMMSSCHQYIPSTTAKPLYQSPVSFQNESLATSAVSNRIRICTYNIQHFTDGRLDGLKRWPIHARRQAAAAAKLIDEIDPDILLIQEIENINILQQLNNSLNAPYPQGFITQFHADYRRGRKQNIAMLSRLTVQDVTEMEFGYMTTSNAPPRGILRAVVPLATNRNLLVYAVHLKSNWGESEINIARRKEALKLLLTDTQTVLSNTPDREWEILVAGDMNVDPFTESFSSDTSLTPLASWHDLWSGIPLPDRTTIPTCYGDPEREFPPAAFDRIIVSPQLDQPPWRARTIQVLQLGINTNNINARTGQKCSSHVSDHYPVFLDIIH